MTDTYYSSPGRTVYDTNTGTVIRSSPLATSNVVVGSPGRHTTDFNALDARISSILGDTRPTRLSEGTINISPPRVNLTPTYTTSSPSAYTTTLPAGTYYTGHDGLLPNRNSVERQVAIEHAKRSALPSATVTAHPTIIPATTIHPATTTVYPTTTAYPTTTVVPGQTILPAQSILLGYNRIGQTFQAPDNRYIKTHGEEPHPNLDLDDPELIHWIENENTHLQQGKNTPYDIHQLLNEADYRVRESRANQIKVATNRDDLTLRSVVQTSPRRTEELKRSTAPGPQQVVTTTIDPRTGQVVEWQNQRNVVPHHQPDSDDEDDFSNFCGICVNVRHVKKQQHPYQ